MFQLTRHEKTHSTPRCPKCSKLMTDGHVCKVKAKKAEARPPENEELKCKICSFQLETKVSWGYHMWKHTKDPSYIQSPDATTTGLPKNLSATSQPKVTPGQQPTKAKAVTSSTSATQKTATTSTSTNLSVVLKPVSDASTKPLLMNPQPVARPQQKPPVQPYQSGQTLQPPAANTSLSASKVPTEALNFPRAPEAHATSYTQISQPLCLQTSRLIVEEPVKPLNMQVNTNANQM